ncbi:ArsR/SmtB family transcription factor [Halostella salina]|uniref:ArsR/SmtB family transcription factor n=1 Tax=Halostella salina TaxID=1547897 RepID=UPI000EF7CA7E|nr:helix-turn-helix domain-containing protein [Halostella salina]
MSGLLPTESDVAIDRNEDPKLLCIDDDRTDEVLATLSSDTSRAVFRALNDEPRTATDVAAELDTSVQSVSYHIENLQEVGLIDVLDTCYSEKGREMAVYGAAEEPYLVFLGPADDQPGLTAAFKRFANALGPVGIVFAVGGAVSRLIGGE